MWIRVLYEIGFRMKGSPGHVFWPFQRASQQREEKELSMDYAHLICLGGGAVHSDERIQQLTTWSYTMSLCIIYSNDLLHYALHALPSIGRSFGCLSFLEPWAEIASHVETRTSPTHELKQGPGRQTRLNRFISYWLFVSSCSSVFPSLSSLNYCTADTPTCTFGQLLQLFISCARDQTCTVQLAICWMIITITCCCFFHRRSVTGRSLFKLCLNIITTISTADF